MNRKATMAKRRRELEQKERAKDRLQRREERKARAAERQAQGIVGPQIGEPVRLDDDDEPIDADTDAEAAADPAAGGAPGRPSSSVKVRPRAGMTPSTEKKLAVTVSACRYSGAPWPRRLKEVWVKAATP